MEDGEAFDLIYDYFNEVFIKRSIDSLDLYLDDQYWDDDIGTGKRNHIRDSKEYLSNLFRNNPSIQIDVVKAIVKDDVITAYLEWFNEIGKKRVIIKKGIGIFEIKNNKIRKRHTYIYFSDSA